MGGNSASSLYKIDPNTGESTLIGPIGFNGVTAMVILGDGRLVATANGDEEFGLFTSLLIEINPRSGRGSTRNIEINFSAKEIFQN